MSRSGPRVALPPVPYLALADVFISAISVLFILLLLSAPRPILPRWPPQGDYQLRCRGPWAELSALGTTGADADPNAAPLRLAAHEVASALARLPAAESLSVRLLILAEPNNPRCLDTLRGTIETLNRELTARLAAGEPGAWFIHDVAVLPEDPAP